MKSQRLPDVVGSLQQSPQFRGPKAVILSRSCVLFSMRLHSNSEPQSITIKGEEIIVDPSIHLVPLLSSMPTPRQVYVAVIGMHPELPLHEPLHEPLHDPSTNPPPLTCANLTPHCRRWRSRKGLPLSIPGPQAAPLSGPQPHLPRSHLCLSQLQGPLLRVIPPPQPRHLGVRSCLVQAAYARK